jgi:enamine deaminase RidA (YjgF/YER057c/UK114 family)
MQHTRLRLSSGQPSEEAFGYSRAVKVGATIYVSGTTAIRAGEVVGRGDAGAQARQAIENIRWALEQFDSCLEDVVRYRAYVADMSQWEPVARELGVWFGATRPAGTLVGTSGLIMPELLVEIEVEAIIGSGDGIDDLTPIT